MAPINIIINPAISATFYNLVLGTSRGHTLLCHRCRYRCVSVCLLVMRTIQQAIILLRAIHQAVKIPINLWDFTHWRYNSLTIDTLLT